MPAEGGTVSPWSHVSIQTAHGAESLTLKTTERGPQMAQPEPARESSIAHLERVLFSSKVAGAICNRPKNARRASARAGISRFFSGLPKFWEAWASLSE